jgi:hypothetical protein
MTSQPEDPVSARKHIRIAPETGDLPPEREPSGTTVALKVLVWIAAVVGEIPNLGTVTAVSLYGLLDERSDASVHRSLSELAPLFDRRRYNRHVLLGGDLNTLAIAKAKTRRLAKDIGVLERITNSFGLVDLLKHDLQGREPPRGRLADCPCDFGDECTHTRTHRRPGTSIPYQDDYLFGSQALADRLERCEASLHGSVI